MNAERIVEILLEGDYSPKEFMASLPQRVLNKFRFVHDDFGGGTKVYLNGPEGSGFIGWIQRMGDTMWYARRAIGGAGSHDVSGPLRNAPEEAAQDLLTYVKQFESINPEDFMSGLPKDFWASFHIMRSGEGGVYADGHLTHLVYLNKDDGTRDFLGCLRPEEGLWYVVQVASPHLTQPGHGTYKRHPVLQGVAGVGFRSKEEAAKGLLRDYLTEK